jgi:hypothetical protein
MLCDGRRHERRWVGCHYQSLFLQLEAKRTSRPQGNLAHHQEYCRNLGRVWESSTQLQIQKKQPHFKFSPPNTPNSSSSTVDLLQKKDGADPQLHGFHGVPQEVLHQIQVSWSWAKLPTTATDYTKTVRSSIFSSPADEHR